MADPSPNPFAMAAADKLFRLGIGLRMVISETLDPATKIQLQSFIDQLGL